MKDEREMDYTMDSGWQLHPIEGDTGLAYMGTRENERVFIKRNSTPLLAALSAEGLTPKLIWSKRTANGDVVTAQEWVEGRTLTKEEMLSEEVLNTIRQFHQSANLMQMLQRIQGEEYTPQRFIDDYLTNLQSGLATNSFLSTVLSYLHYTIEDVYESGKTVCHGDLNHQNFIDATNGNLYLVDWESVRLADPISDLTMLLVQYVPLSDWKQWLAEYGVQVSTNIYERIEWYSLMNCLLLIKKYHFDGRYHEMNSKILLVKSIYHNRIHKKEEE